MANFFSIFNRGYDYFKFVGTQLLKKPNQDDWKTDREIITCFHNLVYTLEHFLGHDPFASLVYSTHYSGVYMQYISLEIETYILILRNILHLLVAWSFLFFFFFFGIED